MDTSLTLTDMLIAAPLVVLVVYVMATVAHWGGTPDTTLLSILRSQWRYIRSHRLW